MQVNAEKFFSAFIVLRYIERRDKRINSKSLFFCDNGFFLKRYFGETRRKPPYLTINKSAMNPFQKG